MWYTERYEGFDTVKPTARAPVNLAAVQRLCSGLLRGGLLLQFIGLTGLFLTYYAYRGAGLFTYDLLATAEEQRSSVGFRVCLSIFSGIYTLGALYLLGFHTTLADDASFSRGYRAGAKLLGVATFLDVISSALLLIFYTYMRLHYDKVWWNQFSSGGVEWSIFTLARLLHAFALLHYASSFFLLEVYHENGTNDWHGILNCFLYTCSGLAGLTVLVACRTGGAMTCALHWITLVSALVWAMAFEQEVNALTPELNEPELTNEVEAQVEQFAQQSPYLTVA